MNSALLYAVLAMQCWPADGWMYLLSFMLMQGLGLAAPSSAPHPITATGLQALQPLPLMSTFSRADLYNAVSHHTLLNLASSSARVFELLAIGASGISQVPSFNLG